MAPGKLWNQILVVLLVIMFLLNTWLIRTLTWIGKQPCNSKELNGAREVDNLGKGRSIDEEQAMVLGVQLKHKSFLTIGIPTVQRDKGFYLYETLQSIIENTSKEDQKRLIIVVFTADFNRTYNTKVMKGIENKFPTYVESGLIRVIVARQSFYPTLQNLKQNFGDSERRVMWRAKQVLDYAFLFQYCEHLADYYLQLEDDVISSHKFIPLIQEFIVLNKDENWSTLEFSELGFIGKLFHSFDLKRFTDFVFMFYQDQPIDYLLKYFNVLNGQKKSLLRVPSLFQHSGQFSSLSEKQQLLQDRFFEDNPRRYSADNPPADVFSSISAFSMYVPNLAYSNDPGYFWGRLPKVGDIVVVVFHEAVRLNRVVFETGSTMHPQDVLRSAQLVAGRQVLKLEKESLPLCQDELEVGHFNNGQIDVRNIEEKIKSDVACLKVIVTESQPHWLLLREIDVWVQK